MLTIFGDSLRFIDDLSAAGFVFFHPKTTLKGGSWMKSRGAGTMRERGKKHPVPWCFYGGVSKRLDIGGCDLRYRAIL